MESTRQELPAPGPASSEQLSWIREATPSPRQAARGMALESKSFALCTAQSREKEPIGSLRRNQAAVRAQKPPEHPKGAGQQRGFRCIPSWLSITHMWSRILLLSVAGAADMGANPQKSCIS